MRAYCFFSVYESLFHPIALGLRERGVTHFSGFTWGKVQQADIEGHGIDYDPLIVFSRDVLPLADDGTPPDIAWLEKREAELGVSIQRMLSAERHLLKGRTHEQILRLAEVVLRTVGDALDRIQPDFLYSEDISCFTSYAHFLLAKERGIPFWCIGAARLPARLSVYSIGFQRSEKVEALYAEITTRGLTPEERAEAQGFRDKFTTKPEKPPGMATRALVPGIGVDDAKHFWLAASRYLGDPGDPTSTAPARALKQRVQRVARIRWADAVGTFEQPVAGEKYVIYPIHFQPEASTLVQAPMYLDQAALIQDIARSLPIGHRLYVKEHVANRGRRPMAFYDALRAIPSVRLIGPDADTWSLIQGASAIAVITGTMGWEGVLFGKPVITFGDVFMNVLPHVYKASAVPKDGWYQLFRTALFEHRADDDAVLALLVALQRASTPGRIHNPNTFKLVIEDENIKLILEALAAAALPRARADAAARSARRATSTTTSE